MKDANGQWLTATYDEVFLLPMLEMACDRVHYIDEYLYLYNTGTGNNDAEVRP